MTLLKNSNNHKQLSSILTLSKILFLRELKSQHRESFLGYFWILLPTIIFVGTFALAQKANILAPTKTDAPLPIFILTGLIYWQLFADTLLGLVRGFSKAKKLMLKITFPVEAMMASSLYEGVFQFLIKCVLLIAGFLFYGIHPGWALAYAPVAAILIFLLGVSMGFILVPLTFFIPDLEKILPTVVNVLMLATPVFYSAEQSSTTSWIAQINPIAVHIEVLREVLLLPNPVIASSQIFFMVALLGLLPLSFYAFRRSQNAIRDRIGN